MTINPAAPERDPLLIEVDARRLKETSAKGSLLVAFAQIFRVALQLGSQVALARLLFPSDFGLVAMVYPVVNFASIFSVGFGEVVVQRQRLTPDQVSSLFWASFAFAWLLTLALWVAAPLFTYILHEPRLLPLLLITAFSVPIGAISGAHAAILTRQMRFRSILTNELLSALLGAAATIVSAWSGWSYWSLIIGAFVLTVSNAVLNFVSSGWRPSRPQLKELQRDDLRFGSNVTGYNLANFLTTSADSLIVGYMNGEHALGLYDRSYRLVVLPLAQLVSPMGRVVVPLLSRLVGDPDEYRAAYLMTLRAIMFATIPGMLVCVVFGDSVVRLFLGERWTQAGFILSWLSVSGLTSGAQLSAVWLLQSQARLDGLRKLTVITSAFSLASYLLGSFWGVRGVAISVGLIFSCLTTPVIMLGATRSGPVGRRHLARTVLPFAFAAVTAAALLWSFRTVSVGSPVVQLACAGAIAYLLFAGVMVAIPVERRRLLQLFRMVAGWRSARRSVAT